MTHVKDNGSANADGNNNKPGAAAGEKGDVR